MPTTDPDGPTRHPNLASALAAFQLNLPRVGKGSKADTGAYTYTYADLADVSEKILPDLAEQGLSYTSRLMMSGQDVPPMLLRCTLLHDTESVSSDWPIALGSPQAIGSSMTYGRRYCLLALTGVAPAGEDDDGASAETEHRELARATIDTPKKATRSRTAKNDDEWTIPATHASDAQRKMMWAMLRALGFDQTEDSAARARRLLSSIVGRKLESSTELTAPEASQVIEALKALQDSPDATEAIRLLIDGQMV